MVKQLSEDEFTAEIVEPIFAEVSDKIPLHYRKHEVDIPHVVETWRRLMVSGVAQTWAGIEGGETVGLLGALFMKEFFTGKLMAMEQFWFVRQAHRRSGKAIALRLFREFEREAKRRGAETIWAGTNVWHDAHRLGQLYARKGYSLWGATYRKLI